jgi:glycosyltransferase involved in cell wall biosynthesis
MKILIDARLYGLENAGLGRYVMNLVTELSKIDKKNEYSILLTKKYYDSLSLPDNWKKILANFRHYSISEQINLPKIIKEENPDIAHFPHFNVPVTFKGKFIVTIHDLLMHKNVGLSATTLPAPLYFLKRLGYKTVFKKAVQNSVKIIVPSLAVKKEVVDYYHTNPEKIEAINEGVDEKIGDSLNVLDKYNLKDPYYIYAGNAYPHKNLKRLIEATVLMNTNSEQKVVLAIASARNIFTQRLQKVVDKLNAKDVVRLLGFVPDEDLGGLFEKSVGFVFPSLSEGFGLPGLEAMSAGTLVLASDIPVFREVYKDNAIYFNPQDFSSIEKSMRNVFKLEADERTELVEKGKDFAKRYSWAKMAEETLKIYEESSDSLRQSK